MALSDSLYDPGLYLALAGTGLGAYSAYQGYRGQQQDYRAQQRAAETYNQMIRDYLTQHTAYGAEAQAGYSNFFDRIMRASSAPLTGRYYKPMSDAEQAAILRASKAGLAERGIQPGGYWDAMTSEVMAKTESDRLFRALGLEQGMAGSGLAALASVGPYRGVPPVMPPQPYVPTRGSYPQFGDLSSLGKWYQGSREDRARTAARAQQQARDQRWEDIYTRALSQPRTTSSPSYFPPPWIYPYGEGESY